MRPASPSSGRAHDEMRQFLRLGVQQLRLPRGSRGGLRAAAGAPSPIGPRATATRAARWRPPAHSIARSVTPRGQRTRARYRRIRAHAGGLLLDAGRYEMQSTICARAGSIAPGRQRCVAAELSRPEFALATGRTRRSRWRCARCPWRPDDDSAGCMRRSCCCAPARSTRRPASSPAAARPPAMMPALLRLLSGSEMLRGRISRGARGDRPGARRSPRILPSTICTGPTCCTGSADSTRRPRRSATRPALDPSNPDAKRSQLDRLSRQRPTYRGDCAVGGELIRACPDNEAARRSGAAGTEPPARDLGRRLRRAAATRIATARGRRGRLPDFSRDCARQGRVIHALIIRETRTRFGDSKLGYGWALLEPILHITMLSLVFAVLMRGRPPIGDEFFIFYFTGIIPYHMFVHTSSSMSSRDYEQWRRCCSCRWSTPSTCCWRAVCSNCSPTSIVAVILLAGFRRARAGGAAATILWAPSIALLVVGLFGCGVGFVNAVIDAFVRVLGQDLGSGDPRFCTSFPAFSMCRE